MPFTLDETAFALSALAVIIFILCFDPALLLWGQLPPDDRSHPNVNEYGEWDPDLYNFLMADKITDPDRLSE